MDERLMLTPSALLAFLTEIEELKDVDISLGEREGQLLVYIGDSSYTLESPENSEVSVSEEIIETLEEINEEGYDEIEIEEVIDDEETIEGGVIKELVKTLALGGLVRMTKNAIVNV